MKSSIQFPVLPADTAVSGDGERQAVPGGSQGPAHQRSPQQVPLVSRSRFEEKKSLSEDNSISSDVCDRPHCFWLVRERVAPSPRVTSSGEGHNPKRISQVFLQPGFMDTWMPGPWWAREGRKEAGNSAQGQNTTGIWGGGRALESFWPGLTPGLVFCCHSWPVPLPSS